MSMIVNPFRFGAGAPPAAEARYWRAFVVMNQAQWGANNGGNAFVGADSVEFRATVGGTNLATDTSKGAVVSTFSGFEASNAFDGINSEYWVSNGGTPQSIWVSYDFTTPVAIAEVLWAKRAQTNGDQESPVVLAVQRSDDNSTWVTDWAATTAATWPSGATAESRLFAKPTTAPKLFWRVRATAVQGGTGFHWATSNIEFRATSGGSDQATGGPAFSNGAFPGGFEAPNAFDGTSSFFHSFHTLSVQDAWVAYGWLSDTSVNEVAVQIRADAFSDANKQAITAGVVESSQDLLTWATEWSFTSPADWVNGTETRVFTRP